MDEYRLKHLEFIQGVINRQAQNSFTVKGWSLTISAAIFTFLLSQDAPHQIHPVTYFITLLPTVAFWLLDAYYLHQERLFRNLYNQVRLDFTKADTEKPGVSLFDMNAKSHDTKETYKATLVRLTVLGIPLTIFLTSLVIFVIDSLIT